MKPYPRWTKDRRTALIQNLDNAGPPWLGAIRFDDSLDQWIARSCLGNIPHIVGVADAFDDALLLLVASAEQRLYQRAARAA